MQPSGCPCKRSILQGFLLSKPMTNDPCKEFLPCVPLMSSILPNFSGTIEVTGLKNRRASPKSRRAWRKCRSTSSYEAGARITQGFFWIYSRCLEFGWQSQWDFLDSAYRVPSVCILFGGKRYAHAASSHPDVFGCASFGGYLFEV